MSIKTVYIEGASKKALNQRLAIDQHALEALEFNHFEGNEVWNVEQLANGTVVKIFSKYVGGNPYAKSYGNIARKADGKVWIK